MNQLGLECTEEALRDGVVEAVGLAAHTACDSVLLEELLKSERCVGLGPFFFLQGYL